MPMMTPTEFRDALRSDLTAGRTSELIPNPFGKGTTTVGALFADWAAELPKPDQRVIFEAAIHQNGVLGKSIARCAEYYKGIYEHHRSH